MKSEFEKLMRNTRPEGAPPLKKSVLDAAKAEWKQSDIEPQLESSRTLKPSEALRDSTLSAARSAWSAKPEPMNFKRWLLATAAVLLFCMCATWYDKHQNAVFQAKIESNITPATSHDTEQVRLAYASELGLGNALLLGTRSFSSIDTPKKEIAWRYIQAKELNN